MKHNELMAWIKANMVREDGSLIQSRATKTWLVQHKDQVKDIMNETAFLSKDARIAERIYCLLDKVVKAPRCPVCQKGMLKFRKHGLYSKTCSPECAKSVIAELSSAAVLKKYGVKDAAQREEVRKKISKAVKRYFAEKKATQSQPAEQPVAVERQKAA